MTGRMQCAYNVSCYRAKNGLKLENFKLSQRRVEEMKHHNITKSFIQRGIESGSFFIAYEQMGWGNRAKVRNWPALCHMFLVKYLMYMSMESLGYCRRCLRNNDCVNLIVEFMGLDKKLIREGDQYREQAFEILRLFHIEQTYFGTSLSKHFDNIKEFASYYPSHQQKLICSAVEAGKKHILDISKRQKWEQQMPNSKWTAMIKDCEMDHNLIYTTNIRPFMPELVKLVNSKAGFDAICMNVDCKLGISSFLTEGNKACRSINLYDRPTSYFDYTPYHTDDESMLDFYDSRFNDSFFLCLMIEMKLAQCHFYRNRQSERVKRVLQQLPDGENLCLEPPEEDEGGDLEEAHSFIHSTCDTFEEIVDNWLPDLTEIVKALWKEGLDDEENLSILFGKKGFVSYIIWTLHEEQSTCPLGSIWRFATSKRLWKVGCIDNDKSLGLKMRYLNRPDRRAKFVELTNLVLLGNAMQGLQPSIEQFIAKFGRSYLGLADDDYFREWMCEEDAIVSKKQKTELDCFSTVEEACGYYFDTASLEEAIWDHLGIPRIIALDGTREKMQKIGWICCGVKATTLGDKAAQLGCRVIHVYDGGCSVWQEV